MNTMQLSEALGEIDPAYLEQALSYQRPKTVFHTKRRVFLLVAALAALLLAGTVTASVLLRGDIWLQRATGDPVEVVRTALENQMEKDYAIRVEVKSVEVDKVETERVVERFIKGVIATRRGWSDEYLAEHFLVVKAVYDAEYDPAKTTRSNGEITMYFYLTQDVNSGVWAIVDNSGNVSLPDPTPAPESSAAAVPSIQEQLFSYLSQRFTEEYSRYYDGLHYEMCDYEETVEGNAVTATFHWGMYFLGKGWDVGTDEGVETQAWYYFQATTTVDESGALDLKGLCVLHDDSAREGPNFSVPLEQTFPTQLAE